MNSETKIEKILTPPLSLALIIRWQKICSKLRALTITRKGITWEISPSLEKTD